MKSHSFPENGLCFEDVYVDTNTNSLKIDNYGDRRYFQNFNHLQNQEEYPDTWQLATILFTLFNKYPPYTVPNSNDKHYLSLSKGNFEKFWELHNRHKHKTPTNIMKLLNQMFSKEFSLDQIEDDPWY